MAALLREAMKVPISNRLLLCAEFVPRGSRAADIGTDHGYLSIYLLREGICPFVTAADLRSRCRRPAKTPRASACPKTCSFSCPTACKVSRRAQRIRSLWPEWAAI